MNNIIFWPIRFYQHVYNNTGMPIHLCKLILLYRNGLLIEHNLVEVNGQNVVGLKVSKIVRKLGDTLSIKANTNLLL